MSTRKFSVGDRVRVNHPGNTYHGTEGSIIAIDVRAYGENGYFIGHRLDIPLPLPLDELCIGTHLVQLPANLILIGDDKEAYDGRETVSWEQCAWQPRALKV